MKKRISHILRLIGFDTKRLSSLQHANTYRRQRKEWLRQGGKITNRFPILTDYKENAGVAKGHYFHQDLLVSQKIYEAKPRRHIDVGSRIDGFVAHVASYREIEVIDIRPMPKSEHSNISFIHSDINNVSNIGKTDSLSCLHAIEHFGLGRYSDTIDVRGYIKGVQALIELLEPNARFYLSAPVSGQDQVHFNAHRVFYPQTILDIPHLKEHLKLERFDYIDDAGTLHKDAKVSDINTCIKYGCGIFTFRKIAKGTDSSE